ncbi:MAG: type II toxin-antitoxin system Phd/YefM family antitoxin [Armatimonadota bacterium]|nr:MAG: type II toxin-antitoxin system Phd/YefM family antitoxin [Armatimonadota bacterium]
MTTMSVSEAKKHLLALVRDAQQQGKVFSLTRKGAPAAVLMSEEQYRSVKETLEVLADPEELKGIVKGRADIASGRVEDLEALLERLDG